jgi:hypothetical protein
VGDRHSLELFYKARNLNPKPWRVSIFSCRPIAS